MRSPESRSGHRPGRTFEEELNLRYLSPGAFTVLSPEDHGSPPDPPQAPPPYRFSPTQKRRKNQAFSIIAEPDPRSRSPSPSGRVSPFKGRGFNPSGSRHVSPAPSPPPEDTRIIDYNRNSNIALPKKSQIPQLKRRSNSIIFSEDGDSSPTYRRKNASLLKPQLSKSLNNIGPKNVSYKPPPNPKRYPGLYNRGFNRLSPIIGSSPEPSSDSKSQSSPSRIPKSRSTPPSRKQSPSRDSSPEYKRSVTRANSRANISRNTSRSNSRNNSRNPSREPSPSSKPPFSPTRIPTRSYKNVQAKVNSYNAKSTTNKVPISKTQETTKSKTKTEEIRGRKLERTDSVNKVVSKNVTSRYLNNNKTGNSNINKTGINNNKTGNNNFQIKIGNTPTPNNNNNNSNLGNKSASNTSINKNSNQKGSNSNLSYAEKKKSLTKTTNKDEQDNNNLTAGSSSSGKGISNAKNSSKKNEETAKSKNNVVNEVESSGDVSSDNSKPVASKIKGATKTESSDNLLKKVESAPKISDMLPSATTVVSTTTTTVTQPLKIEAKLDTPLKKDVDPMKPKDEKLKPRETPMYMDEGRVLSAKSVSSAIERMNDTVLDSQTLMKDHNMSKLTPAASAIISLSNENNTPASKSVTAALPNVETVKNRIDTIGQNVNTSVSNTTNHLKTDAAAAGNNVKNNINKLISPDDTFGAKVNNYEKSANDRIKEARTLVASDVKPIRITVQEKPSNIEVQSGNVRFPNSATNGINSGSSAPPPQNGNQQPEPPKSRCQMFVDRCRNKMPCACCKPKPDQPADEENAKKGCFACLKKKNKKEVEEIIVTNAEEAEAAKKSFMDRLKCCRSNKVGDQTTGCCGRNKRKDSWASRRDSILSEPVPLTRGAKCKNFFKKIFCCGAACCGCSRCCRRSHKIEESASRRASMLSKKKSLTPTVLPPEEPKTKLDTSLVEYTSTMKAAIPVLPLALAYFCLFFNIFAPGTGTVFSGLFCLCMGIPRFSQRDGPKPRIGSFVINTIIGCGQLFTVLFCLVGWGWSIWWGVIMLKVAKKHRKLKKIEERLEAQQAKAAAAAATANANKRDAEKGRS